MIFENFYNQFKQINFSEELKDNLLKSHRFRFNREFIIRADDLTTNDCFSVMRYKHEFIAHYDLDEIIFPRNFDNVLDFCGKNSRYNCRNPNEICSLNPFTFNNSKSKNYFYDYLNSFIESERNGRDREKLRSIDFRRTLTLKPNEKVEVKILKDIQNIISSIDSNASIFFPLRLFIPLAERKKVGYEFLIKRDDVSYIKYLYNSYFDLIPYSYNKFLKDSINLDKVLDENLVRLIYFVTPYDLRQKNTLL
jgi:hypothetical protein